jgi:hypothetical protein
MRLEPLLELGEPLQSVSTSNTSSRGTSKLRRQRGRQHWRYESHDKLWATQVLGLLAAREIWTKLSESEFPLTYESALCRSSRYVYVCPTATQTSIKLPVFVQRHSCTQHRPVGVHARRTPLMIQ